MPSEIAALPTDPRIDAATFAARYRKHCGGFASKDPCETAIDLDGDGRAEKVVRVRERKGKRDGIAVHWDDGRTTVLGAGVAVRVIATDVFVDGVEETWTAFEDSLGGLESCRAVARRGRGFAGRGANDFPAIAPTGDGIWLDGGDAAEILYWDGTQWRRLILGF